MIPFFGSSCLCVKSTGKNRDRIRQIAFTSLAQFSAQQHLEFSLEFFLTRLLFSFST